MDHNFSKLQRLWRNQWRANVMRVEYFPRMQPVAVLRWSQVYCTDWERHKKISLEESCSWRRPTTLLVEQEQISGKCSIRIFVFKKIWKRTMVICWFGFWEKSGILWKRQSVHKEFRKISRRRCYAWFSVVRPCCPEVNFRSTGHGKLSIHFVSLETIETIFRMMFCFYGAVANMCEEHESHHDR